MIKRAACWGVVAAAVIGGSACSSDKSSPSPSASVSSVLPRTMSSAQASAVASNANRKVWEAGKSSDALHSKEITSFAFHSTNSSSTSTVTIHVGSVKSGPTGTVLTFWLTSRAGSLYPAMYTFHPEDYPSLVDVKGCLLYTSDAADE